MKVLFALVAVLLFASIIDAAPKSTSNRKQPNKPTAVHKKPPHAVRAANAVTKGSKPTDKNKRQIPFILPGNPVYPNYYAQPSAPLVDFHEFQSALQAAFLSGVHYAELEKYLKKQNLTDSNGKPLPLDAKALATFEASFGDKKGDAKGAADSKSKFISFDGLSNANFVNPFFLANDVDGKFLKADSGAPSVKGGKLGNVNSSVVALVNPYQSSHVNAVFGPELAPRYEIHYSPGHGLTLDPLTPYSGAGISSAAVGVAPVGPAAYGPATYGPAAFESAAFEPAAYGPEVGPFNGFGVAPGFNGGLLSPYPYPYPFLPGFDPKGLKPNGKGIDGKKLDSTDQPSESTSPSNPEATSETPAEAAPSESPSEQPSESPSSEAPQ